MPSRWGESVARSLRYFPTASVIGSLVLGFCLGDFAAVAQQQVVILDSGMRVGPGSTTLLPTVDRRPYNPASALAGGDGSIQMVDDGLRRTFFNRRRVVSNVTVPSSLAPVVLNNAGHVNTQGGQVSIVNRPLAVTPLDDFGRRIYSFLGSGGRNDIVQGITEISPAYVRLQALRGEGAVQWDMRMSLASIPPIQLERILRNELDLTDPQAWLDLVSFYQQAERFEDAGRILEEGMRRLPQLEIHRRELQSIQQRLANQMFEEVQLRQSAGQPELAAALLRGFNPDLLALETQAKIELELQRIEDLAGQRQRILAQLAGLIEQLEDDQLRRASQELLAEIQTELSVHSLPRLADFVQLGDDATLTPQQRVAVAFSGWLFGAGSGTDNLAIALSGPPVRQLITAYLNARDPAERRQVLDELQGLEASRPQLLARLLAHMPPPIALPAETGQIKGRHRIRVALPQLGTDQAVEYLLQLPPEYDPLRRYPCVLSLHGELNTVESQMEWWVGGYEPQWQMCMGAAPRHGVIVVTPAWLSPQQISYEYTENEKLRAVACLRDAMRRVSIDTDRIFVSGHQIGGDAAWDLALSHPDLWAGLICIGGSSHRYVNYYVSHGRYVPQLLIFGELEGPTLPQIRNGQIFDRALLDARQDSVLVLYKGRGRDHFQEELPQIMQWMQLPGRRRLWPDGQEPFEISVVSLRPGDNFFWWLERIDFQHPDLVHPLLYDFAESRKPVKMESRSVPSENSLRVPAGSGAGYRVWLAPEWTNFNERITLRLQRDNKRLEPTASVETMLDDVRRRGDRQRPFWGFIDVP